MEVKEKALTPKITGTYPPIIEPANTQIVTQAFVDINLS